VLESICVFKSFSVYLMKLVALTLAAYVCYCFLLMYCPFYYYELSFFVSFDPYNFDISYIRYKYFYSCLFSGGIGSVNLLPAFHPKSVFISVNKMGLL
jgi:hypothetical protein